jgi:WASH complex subunit strumpellin
MGGAVFYHIDSYPGTVPWDRNSIERDSLLLQKITRVHRPPDLTCVRWLTRGGRCASTATMEFLDKDNVCGQTLLSVVSSGQAIITELMRLSDHIPPAFLSSEGKLAKQFDEQERLKYTHILFDFAYLKDPERFDEHIDASVDLIDLDEEFRENNMVVLERFYQLFDSIFRYIQDLVSFYEDLTEGNFVHHTLEGILLVNDGRQLMVESLYLYGVMLLLMEKRIPGVCREKMIVAYYRYRGAAAIENLDQVVKLCRTTGYNRTLGPKARPKDYPEAMFARFGIPNDIVEMIIARLRADDIYNHTSAFPEPSQRSVALSAQGAMLYVILFFTPHFLHSNPAVMREVVDKHFNDNWVLAFYMGHKIDLSTEWLPYAAASKALANILAKDNVDYYVAEHIKQMKKCNVDLDAYLTHGVLTDEYVLANVNQLTKHVRACNCSLRWLLLHRSSDIKQYRDAIISKVPMKDLMRLLTNTAQFELVTKQIFAQLLAGKNARWDACKAEGRERMMELSQYFTGAVALTRVKKNEKLQEWFEQLANEIGNLDIGTPNMCVCVYWIYAVVCVFCDLCMCVRKRQKVYILTHAIPL